MKHMNSRRILAMLLALCMMVGMLSMTAFAADAETTGSEDSGEETTGPVTTGEQLVAAFANANDGDTITLGANVEVNAPINVEKSITLDLGEYTANFTGDSVISAQFAFMVGATGSVATFTITGTTGKVTSDYGVVSVRSDGSAFELQGGTLVSNKGHTVENYSFGANKTITISGGAIESKGGNGALHAGENSKLIVTGGKITASSAFAAIYASTGTEVSLKNVEINTTGMSNAVLFATNAAKVTLEDVKVTSDKKIFNASGKANIEVKSGDYTFTGTSDYDKRNAIASSGDGTTISISGGTFTGSDGKKLAVAANYLADNCTIDETTGEVTKEASEDYVAYIGEQGYTTLEAAIEAVQDGEIVEIAKSNTYDRNALNKLANQSKNVTIKARDGVDAVIDMPDAVTMSNSGTTTFENITFQYTTADYHGLQHAGNVVYNNCKINGVVFLYGTSEIFNGCVFTQTESGDAYNVWVYGTPHAEFNGCTFNNAGKTIHVYNENNGKDPQLAATDVTLKSCTVKSTKESGNKSVVNIKTDKVPTELKLAGTNKVYCNETDITDATGLYVFSLYQGTEKPDSVKDSYVYEVTVDEQGEETLKQLATTAKATGVAKITRNGTEVGTYTTLADAFAAAKDGDTITLLDNCSGDGLMVTAGRFGTNGLIVDFADHTYTFDNIEHGVGSGETNETQAAHFESGNKITLKNGKFVVSGETDANGYKVVAPLKILLQNYADLTLDNMILDGTNVSTGMEDLITLSTNNGTVEIIDTQIIAPNKPSSNYYYSYAISVCGFQGYTGTSVKVTGSENGASTITGNIKLVKEGAGDYDLKLELVKGTSTGKLVFKDITPETVTVNKTKNFTVGAPDGYEWSEEGTLVAKETPKNPVAETGGKQYATLQEAIDMATPDAVVILKANTKENVTIDSKKLTLKFGSYFLQPVSGVALTVKNATVTLHANSTYGGIKGASNGETGIAVLAESNAKVTIQRGWYIGGLKKDGTGDYAVYADGNSTVEISGKRFSTAAPVDGVHNVLGLGANGDNSIKVTATDVEFYDWNPLTVCRDGKGFKVGTRQDKDDGGNVIATHTVYTSVIGSLQILDDNGKPVKACFASNLSDTIQSGQTVMLLANATANITIPADKDFTLDLNGKTLNGGTGTAVATITNYGKVTITDSSADKAGKIMRDDAGVVGETSYYVIKNLGTMTIKNGTIYNNSGYKKTNPSGSMVGSSLICNSDNDDYPATLNIEGGTLQQDNFIAIKNGSSGTLVMTGGTVKSGHSAIQNWHDATITGGKVIGQLWTDSYIDEFSTGKTVFGGEAEFEGEIVVDAYYGDVRSAKPTMEITGGNLNVTKWTVATKASAIGAKPEVSGGTFTSEVPANYCKDGFVPATLPGGKYGVEPAKGDVKLIKKDGTTSYIYLANAGSTAVSGDKIELFDNVKTSMAYIKTGVTLDLNGYELEADFIMASGGQVIDSTEGQGLLKVNDSEILLNKANPNLPLFDSDAAGYRLFSYEFDVMRVYQSATDVAANKVGFYFNLKFSAAKAYELLKGTEHGLSIYVPIKVGVDTDWQYVKLLTSTVQDWVTKGHIVYFVKLRGVDGLESGTVVYAATSVRTCGVDNMSSELTYTKN